MISNAIDGSALTMFKSCQLRRSLADVNAHTLMNDIVSDIDRLIDYLRNICKIYLLWTYFENLSKVLHL